MTHTLTYRIHEVAPYINWIYFFHAWGFPPRFAAIVDRFGEDPRAMRQAGIAYCTEQIIDLIANGVGHVHIYTMNQPEIAAKILDNLSEIFEPRA